MTGPLMDAISTLPANSYYFINQRAPLSTVFFAGHLRALLIFAHSIVIIPVIWVLFGTPDFSAYWAFVVGLPLVSVTVISLSILIGLLSCRFRDAGQAIGNALQVVYFLTPVMWMSEFLPERAVWVVELNPFAQMLFLLREPLLGVVPGLYTWVVCSVMAIVSLLAALTCLQLYGRRAVHWM